MTKLKAGVAGAGVFGGFHAQKLSDHPEVDLLRVLDADCDRAQALAQRHGATGMSDVAAFHAGLDLVVVATPGAAHAQLAQAALEAGLHVYVEKPLAVTEADAQALATLAAARGRVLAVGHQERATFAAMGLFALDQAPRALSSVRRGVPNTRNRDTSCVLDLMIHDLDLALALTEAAPVVQVEAQGDFDAVSAQIVFADGLEAQFAASRVAPARERTMRIDLPSGVVEIDFLAPAFTNGSTAPLRADFAARARDPLAVSVGRFVDAVHGRGPVLADGGDGARALALARAVERAAGL